MDARFPRIAALTALLFPLPLLAGCWDREELNELAIVAGTGLDKTDRGRILLTVQIIRPDEIKPPAGGGGVGGRGGGSNSTKAEAERVTSSTGETVYQAVANLVTHTSRHPFFSHNQVLVIGKTAARQGVYPLLDFFIRNPQPRPTIWVLVARGKAWDILRAYDGIEKIDAVGLSLAVQRSGDFTYIPAINLQDFTERLMSKTTAPIAPLVETYEEVGFAKEKTTRTRPLGTAVFKGDRLAGELNLKETRGLMWVLCRVKKGNIIVNYSDGRVSLEIKRISNRITPEIRAGRPYIKVRVDVESNLGDQSGAVNLALPGRIAVLEKKQAAVVRNEILAAVRKAKRINADIFGFGEAFHRRYPATWRELEPRWQELFRQTVVEVTVRSKVDDMGAIAEPLYREK